MKNLDFSKVDRKRIVLILAESQMEAYERNKNNPDAFLYLHVAETNLFSANVQGIDTSKQYERLRRLQSELSPRQY